MHTCSQLTPRLSFLWSSYSLTVVIMTGDKIRTTRKDHKKANKNQAILDAYEETSNGTLSNGTGNHFKSNKAFHKSVKPSALQEQLNANNINGNTSVVAEDSNKNPIILTSDDLEFPVHECVFKGDVRRLSSLIRTHSISQKDVHGELVCITQLVFVAFLFSVQLIWINVFVFVGNTPLHLAVMLGHKGKAELNKVMKKKSFSKSQSVLRTQAALHLSSVCIYGVFKPSYFCCHFYVFKPCRVKIK